MHRNPKLQNAFPCPRATPVPLSTHLHTGTRSRTHPSCRAVPWSRLPSPQRLFVCSTVGLTEEALKAPARGLMPPEHHPRPRCPQSAPAVTFWLQRKARVTPSGVQLHTPPAGGVRVLEPPDMGPAAASCPLVPWCHGAGPLPCHSC